MTVDTLHDTRPIVVGAGVAGLSTALRLSAFGPVRLIAAEPLGSGAATGWAQGGMAAAMGADDSAALHAADTIAAGDGLVQRAPTEAITAAAPDAVLWLDGLGAGFDRDADGALKLGLEAAHSRRRIVHAGGDSTGAAVLAALVAAVRADPRIEVSVLRLRRLLIDNQGAVGGVLAADHLGRSVLLRGARVVLATGGVGGLFAQTTNPLGAIGSGLTAAALAGARLADLEFVQFHPTALAVDLDPMPLVSEALRGEGAHLVDETGAPVMAGHARGDLEPRDVVARSVHAVWARGGTVGLDARALDSFAQRFPQIAAACAASGIDPSARPIPVRTAAHYHMGGIAVDAAGRSSVPGLWACGEVASTGLHGANRLASNSLTEAAVCADALARDVAAASAQAGAIHCVPRASLSVDARPVRQAMAAVGVVRDGVGLSQAVERLTDLVQRGGPAADPALAGLLIATAALCRAESRGAHQRADHPQPNAQAIRSVMTMADLDLRRPVAA
jgi:L-aspartate oxidase